MIEISNMALFKKNLLNIIKKLNLKYFSEIGYIRRIFNLSINSILGSKYLKDDKLFGSFHQKQYRIKFPEQSLYLDKIIYNLRKDGFVKISVANLPALQKPLINLSNFLLDISDKERRTLSEVRTARSAYAKNYWIGLYRDCYPYNSTADPLLLFLSDPSILYICCCYLGQLPILSELEYYYSPAHGFELDRDRPFVGSQLWHLDNDKPNRLKFFYSPYKLDSSHGPTTFIPRQFTADLGYPNYPGYFTDFQADAAGYPLREKIEVISHPCEFWLIDTSLNFHMGSRNPSVNRFLVIAEFAPCWSYLNPSRYKRIVASDYSFPFFNKFLRYTFCNQGAQP